MRLNNQNYKNYHKLLIISQMQRIFSASFRMLKHRKALYETMAYSFNSKITSRPFFKKREESQPVSEQEPMQVQSILKNDIEFTDEDIKRNLKDYNRFFD